MWDSKQHQHEVFVPKKDAKEADHVSKFQCLSTQIQRTKRTVNYLKPKISLHIWRQHLELRAKHPSDSDMKEKNQKFLHMDESLKEAVQPGNLDLTDKSKV